MRLFFGSYLCRDPLSGSEVVGHPSGPLQRHFNSLGHCDESELLKLVHHRLTTHYQPSHTSKSRVLSRIRELRFYLNVETAELDLTMSSDAIMLDSPAQTPTPKSHHPSLPPPPATIGASGASGDVTMSGTAAPTNWLNNQKWRDDYVTVTARLDHRSFKTRKTHLFSYVLAPSSATPTFGQHQVLT